MDVAARSILAALPVNLLIMALDLKDHVKRFGQFSSEAPAAALHKGARWWEGHRGSRAVWLTLHRPAKQPCTELSAN